MTYDRKAAAVGDLTDKLCDVLQGRPADVVVPALLGTLMRALETLPVIDRVRWLDAFTNAMFSPPPDPKEHA